MFIENYRHENDRSIMSGGEAEPIPYPKISPEDWRVWSSFLPVRSSSVERENGLKLDRRLWYALHAIPYPVAGEVEKAARYFDSIEVWRKHQVYKDPIAVGVFDGQRYLIARWGMEKLIPFEAIKKSVTLRTAWQYAMKPACASAGLIVLIYAAWTLFY